MADPRFPHTYPPDRSPQSDSAALAAFLEEHAYGPDHPHLRVVSPDGVGVALPAEMVSVLADVAAAFSAGRSVTLSPHTRMLTTQQAADLLGVSRPTVVKLIDSGEIPADRTSHRRKLATEDVLAYQRRRKDQQHAALAALAVDVFEDDDDLTTTLAELKQVRKDVATRHRRRSLSR